MKKNIIGDTLPKEKRLEKPDALYFNRPVYITENSPERNWLKKWKIKNAIRHLERLQKKYES